MRSAFRGIVIRLSIALGSVLCGWAIGFFTYLQVAWEGPGDRVFWAINTGSFCFFGWVVVGLPLAVWNPDLSTTGRSATAVIYSGLVAVLMIAVFGRSLNVFHQITGFALLISIVSTLVYLYFLRATQRDHRATQIARDP